MVTGLIHLPRLDGHADIERLADTLAALVGGVAAGIVGDAVVVAPRPDREVGAVAEATGAVLVIASGSSDPWTAGAKAARRDWLFCLRAGDVPLEGWLRAVDRFVGTARDGNTIGRLRRRRAGVGDILADLADAALGARGPRPGDVVRRDALAAGRLRVRHLPAAIEPGVMSGVCTQTRSALLWRI